MQGLSPTISQAPAAPFYTTLAFPLLFLISCSYFLLKHSYFCLLITRYFYLVFYLHIAPQPNSFHRLKVFLRFECSFCLPHKFSFILESAQRLILNKFILSALFFRWRLNTAYSLLTGRKPSRAYPVPHTWSCQVPVFHRVFHVCCESLLIILNYTDFTAQQDFCFCRWRKKAHAKIKWL